MIREDCSAEVEPCVDLIRALTAAELHPFNKQDTVNMQPTHITKALIFKVMGHFSLLCITSQQLLLDPYPHGNPEYF